MAEQSKKSLDLSRCSGYRQFVESAQQGIAAIDSQGVCTLLNDEFARLLGRPLDQILNRHYTGWDVPELYRLSSLWPDGALNLTAGILEVEVRTADGLECILRSMKRRCYPRTANRLTTLLTLTDLTTSKRAEDAIRRSEGDYRLLFESSPNARLLVDRDTYRIYNVNTAACDLLGYSREEFAHISMLDLQTPDGVESSRELFATPFVQGKVSRQYRRKNGTVCDVTAYAHDQEFEGRPCRQLLIVDQTEQLIAAKKLRESQQMLAMAQEIAQIGSLQVRSVWRPRRASSADLVR